MTNEAIKALMVFALYGILEIVLCFSSVDKLKAALTVKTRRATTSGESLRSTAKE